MKVNMDQRLVWALNVQKNVRAIFDLVPARIKRNQRQVYEYNNIIERFVISYFNLPMASEQIYLQLIKELKDKRLMRDAEGAIPFKPNQISEAHRFAQKIKSIINQHSEFNHVSVNALFQCYFNANDQPLLDYLNHSKPFLSEVLKGKNPINREEQKKLCYTRMKLVYDAISVNASQHWSIPYSFYEHLYKTHGIVCEGFANPLNSKSLELSIKTGCEPCYCSLFPEIDKFFGSIGSFFDIELKDSTWWINPPFILSIINLVVDKIIASINESPLTIFIILPNWSDCDYIAKLRALARYTVMLQKNKHYFVDYNKKAIPARFESILFILSTNKDYALDVDKCVSYLMV